MTRTSRETDVNRFNHLRRATRLAAAATLLAGTATAASLATSPTAAATSITVDKSDDVVADDGFCTLREALTAANTDSASGTTRGECPAGSGDDTIVITPGIDKVTLSLGQLVISSDLTLNANGATIDGDLASRAIDITGGSVTLNDLVITRGSSGSAGGGIDISNATVAINGSLVTGNVATTGAGIHVVDSVVDLLDSSVTGNDTSVAGTGGSGIRAAGTSFLTLVNTEVDDNLSLSTGGGLRVDSGVTAMVIGGTVNGNEASLAGGGIEVTDGAALTITGATISGNTAGSGGGIVSAGTTTIETSTVSGNSATTSRGGGISASAGVLGMFYSTVSGNDAADGGGGIHNLAAAVTVSNSTISGNLAGGISGLGGGVFADSSTTIMFSTISRNTTAVGGVDGVLARGSGTAVTVGASIIADNSLQGDDVGVALGGSFVSEGFNVVGDGFASFTQPGDVSGITNAHLGPLADNGGATLTHAPTTISSAVDRVFGTVSGDLLFDQRLVLRPQGINKDSGAVEARQCAGQVVTVDLAFAQSPTTGDDVVSGTPNADTIDGLDGNDVICGLDGDDVIDGGPGLDTIFGDGGVDDLEGGQGNDTIYGGAEGDTIYGTGGGDVLFGEGGDDDIRGGNGNDTIEGGPGADVLRGQNGEDQIWANSAADSSTTDVDEMYGGGLFDDVFGDAGDDVMYGGNFADVLSGKAGDDQLFGNNGADTLRGGPHVLGDTCNGGTLNSGAGDTATACETVLNVP